MYSDAVTDQPLLHKIMWDNRSCDIVSRPMKELSQHFTELLGSYCDDKVSERWGDYYNKGYGYHHNYYNGEYNKLAVFMKYTAVLKIP